MDETTEEAGYFRPKSTFFRGVKAAAMGVFSASTTGAASRKCRISVEAKSGSRAAAAGNVVLNPHCRHCTRSIAGWSLQKPLGGRISEFPSNSEKVLRTAGFWSSLRNAAWLSSSQWRMAVRER